MSRSFWDEEAPTSKDCLEAVVRKTGKEHIVTLNGEVVCRIYWGRGSLLRYPPVMVQVREEPAFEWLAQSRLRANEEGAIRVNDVHAIFNGDWIILLDGTRVLRVAAVWQDQRLVAGELWSLFVPMGLANLPDLTEWFLIGALFATRLVPYFPPEAGRPGRI